MDTNRDQRDQARWIILLGTLAGALYLCWLMLEQFIGVLLWAAVLTMTFEPVHRRIVARTKRPNLSAALSCLLVVLAIGIPAGLISWAILHEIVPAVSNLEGGVSNLLSPDSPYTGKAIQWLGQHIDLEKARAEIVTQLGSFSTAARTVAIVGSVVGTFVEALFVVFVMFYLFRDGTQVRAALSTVIPLRHRETYAIFLRTREVVGASVYGVLVIAMVQGALGGLAFWALGLPSAVLWSVAMMFLSLIPVTGAFVVWVPAAIYLAVSGAWISAILLALWGTLVIGTIDNFLRPSSSASAPSCTSSSSSSPSSAAFKCSDCSASSSARWSSPSPSPCSTPSDTRKTPAPRRRCSSHRAASPRRCPPDGRLHSH
jgi:predicted PurR-regulated permease PerM